MSELGDKLMEMRKAREEAGEEFLSGDEIIPYKDGWLDEYRELVALRAEVANYEVLKRAVNESTNECSTQCDEHGHAGDCPANNSARWLEDQQREIESLRAEIESLRAERDALKARLAEAERVCPHCGSKLWQCYDARRYGAIACCPDCDHRATDSAPTARAAAGGADANAKPSEPTAW